MRIPDIQTYGRVYFRSRIFEPEELSDRIDRLAKYLSDQTSDRTPFVYLLSPNHLKFIVAYFAIIKAKKICVLVEPNIGEIEYNEMRAEASPAAVIRVDTSTMDFSHESEIELCGHASELSHELEDVCTMIYTAGDDGRLKAAMLTHENMVSDAISGAECDGVSAASVSCAAIPYNHLFGLVSGFLGPAALGGGIFISDPDKSFSQTIAELVESPVTHLYAVPMILHLMTRARLSANTDLENVVCGGVALPAAIHERFRKKTGLEIRQGYGLSEAAPICTLTRPGDTVISDSVGRALTCCTLKVADSDSAPPTEHGPRGEILVQGANVMKGYYRHPQATTAALSGGYLHTGDIGTIDQNGYLRLLGLKKRMYNLGGVNIYPSHIERLLCYREEVRSASLTTVPYTSLLGSARLHATIQLREGYQLTTEDMTAWCAANLSPKNRPHIFTIV
jgi:long-chain acyl-CoA synthetase